MLHTAYYTNENWNLNIFLDSADDPYRSYFVWAIETKAYMSGCKKKKKKIWEQEEKACMDKTLILFLEFLLSAKKKHPVFFLASVSEQGQMDGPGHLYQFKGICQSWCLWFKECQLELFLVIEYASICLLLTLLNIQKVSSLWI